MVRIYIDSPWIFINPSLECFESRKIPTKKTLESYSIDSLSTEVWARETNQIEENQEEEEEEKKLSDDDDERGTWVETRGSLNDQIIRVKYYHDSRRPWHPRIRDYESVFRFLISDPLALTLVKHIRQKILIKLFLFNLTQYFFSYFVDCSACADSLLFFRLLSSSLSLTHSLCPFLCFAHSAIATKPPSLILQTIRKCAECVNVFNESFVRH